MKTSGGKYIAPQHVEGCLGKDPLIEQIIVFAQQRHFVSALIVSNRTIYSRFAKNRLSVSVLRWRH